MDLARLAGGTGGNDCMGVRFPQAIILALQMIGADLYTSNYHKAGSLILEGPGPGYGFPVPNNIRDLLEGDDVKFF